MGDESEQHIAAAIQRMIVIIISVTLAIAVLAIYVMYLGLLCV